MAQFFKDLDPQGPLVQVREGMAVYDSADKKVGTVKEVYIGDGSESAEVAGTAPATNGPLGDRDDSFLGGLITAIGGGDHLPGTARAHLLRVGYIAIDAAGIFSGDRFATTEQVATVAGDRVVLSVASDELIRS